MKTITIWKARDIFSPEVVRSVEATVENIKSRQFIPEDEKILRKIEEIRRQVNKRFFLVDKLFFFIMFLTVFYFCWLLAKSRTNENMLTR